MDRRSGNRRADRVPRDPPAVRHRRDFRQQSEDWGWPAAPARARHRGVSAALDRAATRSPSLERTDS